MATKEGLPTHADEVHETPRKGGVMNNLYPPGPQPGAKGRVKNHCRKFWWCDCLVLIVIVLVIVLPIIYVAIPKKVQHEINASSLEVTSQEVTEPAGQSAQLKLASIIRSGSKYHPNIDGFVAALALKDQGPFTHINIPSTKSEAEVYINVDQKIDFTSLDAFSKYATAVLGAEEFDVYFTGKTNVHLSGLPSMDVKYNQKVTMKGLNKLHGLNITSIQILSGASQLLSDGSNMIGTVYIPNPSVMTLDLGNVTMNLAIDDDSVGYALLPNLVLKPGNNTVPMQAHVKPLDVVQKVTQKYKNAIVPLAVSGNSSVRDGVHLTYYEEAIKSNTVMVDLNVGPALEQMGIRLNTTGS